MSLFAIGCGANGASPDADARPAPIDAGTVADAKGDTAREGPSDPASDAIYIITKLDSGSSAVYRLNGTFGQQGAVASKVADLPVPKSGDRPATSASAHPCGAGFLLRTYNTLYEFRIPTGSPFESAFRASPLAVSVATESQGEAVAYSPDGLSYFTTGEGAMPAINRVECVTAGEGRP